MTLYLVQRAVREDRPGQRGVDSMFRFSYMGSSEFEFGSLPESLRRIRAGRDVGLSTVEINGRTVYLYGPAAGRDDVGQALPQWVADGCHGKEASWFHNALDGTLETWQRVNTWWSLDDDVWFTLEESIAADIEEALTR